MPFCRGERRGETAVVEIGGHPGARVELVEWLVLGARKEEGIREDRRRQVVLALAAVVGVQEGQLRQREDRAARRRIGEHAAVQLGQGTLGILPESLVQVPAVEDVLAEEARLVRGKGALTELARHGARIDPLHVDGRPACRRHEKQDGGGETTRVHPTASLRMSLPGSAPLCSPFRMTTRPLTIVATYPSARCDRWRAPVGKSCRTSGSRTPRRPRSITFRSAAQPRRTRPRSRMPYNSAGSRVRRFTASSSARTRRRRTQYASVKVGTEASQIWPACAPASPSPMTDAGCVSIACTASSDWLKIGM